MTRAVAGMRGQFRGTRRRRAPATAVSSGAASATCTASRAGTSAVAFSDAFQSRKPAAICAGEASKSGSPTSTAIRKSFRLLCRRTRQGYRCRARSTGVDVRTANPSIPGRGNGHDCDGLGRPLLNGHVVPPAERDPAAHGGAAEITTSRRREGAHPRGLGEGCLCGPDLRSETPVATESRKRGALLEPAV